MIGNLKRKIHVACRQLGLDSDARKDMQELVTGKASMTDMSEVELQAVVNHLKGAGFKDQPGGRKKHPRAKHGGVRFIHVLWSQLGSRDKLKDPTRDGLNKFIRKRFGNTWGAELADVDMLTEHEQISDVINALKDWCQRAGIELEQ